VSLTEEDKQWIREQLERVETRLLAEFHKWASPLEARQRTPSAALLALDVEMEQ
jgi:U3 small nucleolar ribonucleoprotein component